MSPTHELLYKGEFFTEPEKKILLEPLSHLQSLPKIKVVDPEKVIKAINWWFNLPSEKCNTALEILQLTIESNYMKEEILFEEVWPNKQGPTVQVKFGVPVTINASSFSLLLGFYKSLQLSEKGPTIHSKYSQQFLKAYFMLTKWKRNKSFPTKDEYKKMCIRKHQSTFRMLFELMQDCSNKKIQAEKLLDICCQFFQIYEDYQNLFNYQEKWSKNYLYEEVLCFPIVHAIHNEQNNNKKVITNLFKSKLNSLPIRQYLLELLEKNGSMEYTRKTLVGLRDQAQQELEHLEKNPLMLQLLDDIVVLISR